MPFKTCPIIRLDNLFRKLEPVLFIRNDFQHRQAINRMYVLMRSAGIVKREERKLRAGTLKKNYEAKREYKVHLEGVQFSHVKYIVIGFSFAVPLAIFIAILENVHFHLKYHRPREIARRRRINIRRNVLDEDLLTEITNSAGLDFKL